MKDLYIDTIDIDEILDNAAQEYTDIIYNLYEDILYLKEEITKDENMPVL